MAPQVSDITGGSALSESSWYSITPGDQIELRFKHLKLKLIGLIYLFSILPKTKKVTSELHLWIIKNLGKLSLTKVKTK